MTAAFDLLLLPFQSLAPIWGLLFISLVSGVIFLLIYGRCSSQRRIAEVKKKISAAVLEVVLFRRDFGLCLRVQARMLGLACQYLSLAVPPLVVLAIPGLLILSQLNLRYNVRPLRAGEQAVLKVETKDAALLDKIALVLPDSAQSTPPVRIAAKREAWWRIDVVNGTPGDAVLRLNNGAELRKTLAVGEESVRPIPTRNVISWWDWVLYPGEALLDSKTGVVGISLSYPEARYHIFGFEMHWIVIFLVASLASGLVAAKVLHIEV